MDKAKRDFCNRLGTSERRDKGVHYKFGKLVEQGGDDTFSEGFSATSHNLRPDVSISVGAFSTMAEPSLTAVAHGKRPAVQGENPLTIGGGRTKLKGMRLLPRHQQEEEISMDSFLKFKKVVPKISLNH
ncbi:MAG: hypothetical protein ABID54_04980, partial [Pseudomonadota bacterium]